MRIQNRLLGLLLFSLLSACPKPPAPNKLKPPPNQTALRGLMQHADAQRTKAGPVASETSDFIAAAREVANDMKATRDLYSPDPAFYQLADEAFVYATQSAEARDPALRALAWSNTARACQQCHLRYGGPKTYSDSSPPK
jgi:hypothetical protein